MALIAFLLQAFIISLSGVMAPGPLTSVTLGKGNDSPHAGALIAVGHGIIEFPLILLLLMGLGSLMTVGFVGNITGLLGGVFLLYMAVGMLRGLKWEEPEKKKSQRSAIATGILLSGGNPYFLLWWATVGVTLVMQSTNFGPVGFLLFAFVHWFSDFIWLYFLSVLSYTGGHFFGRVFQKSVSVVCGIALFFFGTKFIYDVIARVLTSTPA
ncbi:LysE family transporter [Candidatus Hydrogenedentota bacterium]